MSEPITLELSKLQTPEELCLITISDCQTPRDAKVCESSSLNGEDKQRPHNDSVQPGRFRLVPIHLRPDLLVSCADMVNSEWQRSQAARVHSLQKSCQEFPVCLVLLQGHKETEKLLGHVRLSRVVDHSRSLFLESVIISKAERGKGYGRILMEETELYTKRRGFKRLCLTTHDKQHFYSHLGYVLSTPVQNAGNMLSFVSMETLLRFSKMQSNERSTQAKIQTRDFPVPQDNRDSEGSCVVGSPPPFSLPPPPPLPPSRSITTCLLPPSPSIPSPPPPPSPAQPVVQTLTQTPYRDARGVPIYWMHKDV